jgi:hypothetical protein
MEKPDMKIYFFDPTNGFYVGEDIVDEVPLENGTFMIPSNATTIMPPDTSQGYIWVF